MPNYQAYPTVADTPNRNQRKARRRNIFQANKSAGRIARKARREAKRAGEKQ